MRGGHLKPKEPQSQVVAEFQHRLKELIAARCGGKGTAYAYAHKRERDNPSRSEDFMKDLLSPSRRRMPSIETVLALAKELHTTFAWLAVGSPWQGVPNGAHVIAAFRAVLGADLPMEAREERLFAHELPEGADFVRLVKRGVRIVLEHDDHARATRTRAEIVPLLQQRLDGERTPRKREQLDSQLQAAQRPLLAYWNEAGEDDARVAAIEAADEARRDRLIAAGVVETEAPAVPLGRHVTKHKRRHPKSHRRPGRDRA